MLIACTDMTPSVNINRGAKDKPIYAQFNHFFLVCRQNVQTAVTNRLDYRKTWCMTKRC